MQLNSKIFGYFASRKGSGAFILQGGRRSGKTFAICQRLLLLCYAHRRVVNVASMTMEQGRLGAYADMKSIIESEPALQRVYEVRMTPREIRNRFNGSQIFFNSYQHSETAKGVSCDYLFLNEANNFSEQHYIDLLANVRKGVFIDFNPNIDFWVYKYYRQEDILVTTWKDNRFLTDIQKQYFIDLKVRATSDDASAMDVYLYKVYYCGERADLAQHGDIFSPDNIQRADEYPERECRETIVFCDPSALVGNDYFACVFASFCPSTQKIYVIDTFSVNAGTKEDIVHFIRKCVLRRDRVSVYVETNGIIGQDFYMYLNNSNFDVLPLYSHTKKYERVLANYNGITRNVVFVNTERTDEFLEQVYTFSEKCEHDDNIDAINSMYNILKYNFDDKDIYK